MSTLAKLWTLAASAFVLTAVWCESLDVALGPDHLWQPFVLGAGPLVGAMIAWDVRRLRRLP